ncbi:MAG: hypothetical protein AAF092_15080 [Pseudomonadota bacterium]
MARAILVLLAIICSGQVAASTFTVGASTGSGSNTDSGLDPVSASSSFTNSNAFAGASAASGDGLLTVALLTTSATISSVGGVSGTATASASLSDTLFFSESSGTVLLNVAISGSLERLATNPLQQNNASLSYNLGSTAFNGSLGFSTGQINDTSTLNDAQSVSIAFTGGQLNLTANLLAQGRCGSSGGADGQCEVNMSDVRMVFSGMSVLNGSGTQDDAIYSGSTSGFDYVAGFDANNIAPVPVPAGGALLAAGLVLLSRLRRHG